ncbi:BON domain-containing protein [Enhydrobacter aerosaccus]|uniref:BON domain-containing protein n=1 Tax=Enhydrobacter aerosaccus TaxID=225324 RepID=A0A1T4RA29_9HYPH|nr:CBS domain-containing protein [Enhydrobacter aerosaccus]SKA12471.1 BON domain-containing protein [Enhydrobacter aerosaccus]
MRAKDVMTIGVVSVLADASVFDAAEILTSEHVSALPVIDDKGRVIGIVSEADLIRRAEIETAPHKSWLHRWLDDDVTKAADYVRSHSRRVRDVMTKNVVTVEEGATLGEIAELMAKHGIKRVPVVQDGVMVGIVSRANLLQALMSREPDGGGSRPSDAQLRRDVADAVSKHGWSSAWPTNIVVSNGVVHLWGFVQSDAVRNAYRVAAENVPGVKSVKNHMRTVPPSVNMGV